MIKEILQNYISPDEISLTCAFEFCSLEIVKMLLSKLRAPIPLKQNNKTNQCEEIVIERRKPRVVALSRDAKSVLNVFDTHKHEVDNMFRGESWTATEYRTVIMIWETTASKIFASWSVDSKVFDLSHSCAAAISPVASILKTLVLIRWQVNGKILLLKIRLIRSKLRNRLTCEGIEDENKCE